MITTIIYIKDEKICGFQISGHAGFAEAGEDIVCASVTTLAFNTVNAIEAFTEIPFQTEVDEENLGFLKFVIPLEGMADHDTQLLLQTMVLGFKEIEKEYNEYLTLIHKEV